MRFSEELRSAAEPVWRAIFNHPMLQQIRDGSLPIEKFKCFLSQDWHYLEAFARCVGLAIGKAREAGALNTFQSAIDDNAPFYSEEVFREVDALLRIAKHEQVSVQIGRINDPEWFKDGEESRQRFFQQADVVGAAMRKRLGQLAVRAGEEGEKKLSEAEK